MVSFDACTDAFRFRPGLVVLGALDALATPGVEGAEVLGVLGTLAAGVDGAAVFFNSSQVSPTQRSWCERPGWSVSL